MNPFPIWFWIVFIVLLIVSNAPRFLSKSVQFQIRKMYVFRLLPVLWLLSILFITPSKSIVQVANSSNDTILKNVEVIYTDGQRIDFGDIKPHSTRIEQSPVEDGKTYQILFTYNEERRITETIKANGKEAISPLQSRWTVYQENHETE